MTELLSIRRTSDNGTVTLALRGEIDLSVRAELEGAIEDAMNCSTTGVVVNLAGISYIDSTGLHALVSAFRACGAKGLAFRVEEPSDAARRLLDITGLAGDLCS